MNFFVRRKINGGACFFIRSLCMPELSSRGGIRFRTSGSCDVARLTDARLVAAVTEPLSHSLRGKRASLGSAERASHPRKTRPTNGYLLSVATRADSYEEDRRLFVPASTNCLVISRYTKCAAQYVVYLSLDLFSGPNTSRIICSMKLVVYLYRAMLNAC